MKPKKPNHYSQQNQNQQQSQPLRNQQVKKSRNNTTSWSAVSTWYDDYLKDEDNYQHKVILPNLLRLLDLDNFYKNKDFNVLDLGCGQGFFMEKILDKYSDIKLHGVDISSDLLNIASKKFSLNKNISLQCTDAENLSHISDNSFDKVYSVLALQNMVNVENVIKEIKRILKKGGKCLFVINHPSFRVPKESDWKFDNTINKQGRVVYTYMSDKRYIIDMNPGLKALGGKSEQTISFHHPLQFFSKIFNKHGFAISRIEEWLSHKKSEKGLRQQIEDDARKEIPMFMCLELVNIAK